ncbi:hypothetical protein GOP47_0009115, partial [Adiantum capillus-veneris]
AWLAHQALIVEVPSPTTDTHGLFSGPFLHPEIRALHPLRRSHRPQAFKTPCQIVVPTLEDSTIKIHNGSVVTREVCVRERDHAWLGALFRKVHENKGRERGFPLLRQQAMLPNSGVASIFSKTS